MTSLVEFGAMTSMRCGVVGALGLLLVACGGGAGGRRASIEVEPMPSGGSFTGVYHSPQYGEMHVVQSGSSVVGEYGKDERKGRIEGTVQGNVLRFRWEERRELVRGRPVRTSGRGYFRYVRGEDGRDYLLGEWGVGEDEIGGGEWRAVKLRKRRPRNVTAGGERSGTGSGALEDEGASSGYDETSGGMDDDYGSSEPEPTDTQLEGLDEF